jgi:hypothetical protein
MPSDFTEPIVSATGRGVRVAIVDSGVHGSHPHVGGLAGGIRIIADGGEDDDYVDRIGHGTAVAGAIREKAIEAELLAVRVFDTTLSSDVRVLLRGIEWAARAGCQLINLSLGTTVPEHERALREAVAMATDAGAVIVAAGDDHGTSWLPGTLPGVIQVRADWVEPREIFSVERDEAGAVICRASGYPRPIPGVPIERNLKGVSFAVANMTGFAARFVEPGERVSFETLANRLQRFATLVRI